MIILKNPIEGYNNKLKVSTEDMVFGINKDLNYQGKKEETLSVKKSPVKTSPPPSSSSNENVIILSLALVGGVLISKYIL